MYEQYFHNVSVLLGLHETDASFIKCESCLSITSILVTVRLFPEQYQSMSLYLFSWTPVTPICISIIV